MANKPGKGYGWKGAPVADAEPAFQTASYVGDHDAVGLPGGSGSDPQADADAASQRLAVIAAKRREVQQAVFRMNLKILKRR